MSQQKWILDIILLQKIHHQGKTHVYIQQGTSKLGPVGYKGQYHGLNSPWLKFHPTFEPFCNYSYYRLCFFHGISNTCTCISRACLSKLQRKEIFLKSVYFLCKISSKITNYIHVFLFFKVLQVHKHKFAFVPNYSQGAS